MKSPEIREQFGPDKPDRTTLILPLELIGKASNEANHDANDAICKQILELRRTDSKTTQTALAEKIGFSRATVQRTIEYFHGYVPFDIHPKVYKFHYFHRRKACGHMTHKGI